jgi:enediyne biosynthesis protein E4
MKTAPLDLPARRNFLRALGVAGLNAALIPRALGALGRRLNGTFASVIGDRRANAGSAGPVFEQIPNSTNGISWVHVNGRSADMYLPETVGAGCAFLDYDNDGWMDIYLINSGNCDFYHPEPALRNALYKNNRDGTFTDVTLKAGVSGNAYGMGVAVGDYDGDGFPDLYVTQYPRSILYHNNGDGTFTDVTAKAGVTSPGWGTSAVWFDYDNDGRLDLFVGRFVDYDKSKNKWCGDRATNDRYYCIPSVYEPAPSRLFHNNGDGTFTDVSKESGIAASLGKAWGAVAADINNDGLMDLFVSNDTVANFLFVNRGHGKFEEDGLLDGVGYSAYGRARSGMGVDAADFDQDGWIDLFVANVDHEMYSLYHNNKDGSFTDLANQNGIGPATKLMSGWGLKFFDYDNDGNLDLFLCDGHPDDKISTHVFGVTYREPLLLFRNTGAGFENVSSESGPIFKEPLSGRGMALGDFNNDGRVEVLLTQNGGPPILLKNTGGAQNHWIGLRLIGKKANIDAIGAKITYQAGDLRRHVFKVGGGSYASSHDPRVVLGLGPRAKVDWVEVKWPQPSGLVERFADLSIDRYTKITEGQGTPQR